VRKVEVQVKAELDRGLNLNLGVSE